MTSSSSSSSGTSDDNISDDRRRSSSSHYDGPFPELVIFDLDACFWDQEMYTLSIIPTASNVILGELNGRGIGVIGVMSGRTKISLHYGSLIAFQSHYDNKYTSSPTVGTSTKFCFASSADTELAERIGRAALQLLEVVPGVTVWDVVVNRDWGGVDINQIGRRPPLSANKSTSHFPILREVTRIRYDRMLFFDDCQWEDHCGIVERVCKEQNTGKGVVTCRTPLGLGIDEWEEGLEKYAKVYQAIDGVDNYDIKKK
jgi:magnesium-dependent phosphatase 1